jgi:hypothetical protein
MLKVPIPHAPENMLREWPLASSNVNVAVVVPKNTRKYKLDDRNVPSVRRVNRRNSLYTSPFRETDEQKEEPGREEQDCRNRLCRDADPSGCNGTGKPEANQWNRWNERKIQERATKQKYRWILQAKKEEGIVCSHPRGSSPGLGPRF